MQALQKHYLSKAVNLYKLNIAKFSSDWTSNSMTGEAITRQSRMSVHFVNGFSVFNRPNLKTKTKVNINAAKIDSNKDFPGISQKIAFLTGGKSK
jgi:hypothetical protein